ncbi:hypothetical protein EV361DRAFT_812602 [Lentinula raphanica]|uniref:Uncharacterized protein n=1 Tax=Lentinula raphanica TaxID=153919 RepID=A0AA38NWD5_9AGAR|nr:hypothetical protein F5878DRAFT_549029 [Lentinula raphanica]KAJ3964104.1 hypothetical protein EV361DRAFT_812602 [Lentinula raphanica]
MTLGLALCLARLIFHFVYRIACGLASACWKIIYLFTLASLVALPFLSTFNPTVLRPFCLIPGVANISLCSGSHPFNHQISPLWADFPRLMNAQSSTFEQLLDNSVGGSTISLDVKKAEMAMADLVVLVKYSNLSSKDVLGDALSTFAHEARRAGRGLQTLGSKVGGAVDLILAVNEYAMAKLDSLSSSSSFISQALVPFQSASSLEKMFLLSFAESMNTLSTVIQRLILLAEVELSNLEKLEEHLSLIHEIVSREDSSIAHAKSELLGELWTWLGGNQHELDGYNAHLDLLHGISGFRKQALARVVSALQILRALSEDMESMRERMMMPELVGSQIPLEIQIISIQHGLQRLRDSKALAKEREDGAIKKVTSFEG